jgi:membrane fusion protein (multidrug efflux system)
MNFFKRKRNIILLVLIIFIAVVGYKIYDYQSLSARRAPQTQTVVLGNPEKRLISNYLSLTGDIIADKQANIYARVSGNIEKIYVDIGQYVNRGEILAIIDSSIYTQNALQAQGLFAQAEANYQNAQMNYERNSKLYEQKLISKQDYDYSQTSFEVAKAQREAQFANFTNAQTQLSYCKVTAPFSGYITKRMFDEGAYISASAATQSSTLFVLMDINKVKITANLPEKNIDILNKVKEADIKVDALKDKNFKGTISRASEAVDLATRTLPLQIIIDNKGGILKPGMFASIIFTLEQKENSLTLPLNTVLTDDDGTFVYKFMPDSTVGKTYVEIGIQENNVLEIVQGLTEDDQVVIVGQTLVRDNMKIRVAR